MSSTFLNRRRSRLAAVLATAVASLAVAASTQAPSTAGAQTARSSWSTAPEGSTANVDFILHTYRSSWS